MSDAGSPMLTSLTINNPIARDVAAFIGEVARPTAIIATSVGAAASSVILALKVNSPEAAVYMGALFLGVGTLFGVKGWEKVTQIRGDSAVQQTVAKSAGQ